MGKLDGKVALITGAAVGLGEGISTAYAKYGAKLVMVDLDPKVEETAARLRKEYGAEIVTVVANVADREQMDAAAKKGADTFWEVYDPNDDFRSPYNFFPINSYCHAWSCTPVYFINKYPEIFQK